MSSTPDASIPGPVAGFITGARVGRLATADADGRPTVVPICYAFDGRALYSAVDAKPKQARPEGLKRIRNLRENPRVSVVIDEYDEDWTRLRYVIIQGRADPSFVVSHRVSLDEAPEMYEAFDKREEGVTKVLLEP